MDIFFNEYNSLYLHYTIIRHNKPILRCITAQSSWTLSSTAGVRLLIWPWSTGDTHYFNPTHSWFKYRLKPRMEFIYYLFLKKTFKHQTDEPGYTSTQFWLIDKGKIKNNNKSKLKTALFTLFHISCIFAQTLDGVPEGRDTPQVHTGKYLYFFVAYPNTILPCLIEFSPFFHRSIP